ncbi:hypothetical protein BDV29DRAFT_19014 [Aspergillus leporis]|jgi:2-haloacid dehalogenase|uniref:HAD-like domain-containing protein n=1 Tax=Aspergillus leporis TaxID=41062 RepID=A0A5N5WSP6_9EURO|nr:hypothetical protein BDV29DRAFT_19014 [Aspergillus leporis]
MNQDKPIVVAFDIYGTMLSPGSIAKDLEQYTGNDTDRARSIAALWRRYQLEYTRRLNSTGILRLRPRIQTVGPWLT